jgi:hypothetical protein
VFCHGILGTKLRLLPLGKKQKQKGISNMKLAKNDEQQQQLEG